jgi:hypothetical protein
MPASALAASPRRFVRLLGLNSSRWPRGIAEDRLIPDHIIPTPVLDPLPVNLADRRDFETILATTAIPSFSRAPGATAMALLGRSPLLAGHGDETYLRRNATPAHAFSETDRLMARPQEFAADPQAVSAQGCWRDWRQAEITAHDGLVRRIIRSSSPSSAAPSRPARCAACCAIRSASCGSMRSDGANRRAAPNRSCSTRSGSAILSTWFSTEPCAISKPQAALPPPTLNHRSSGGAGGASRRRRLGERAPGSAGRHLGRTLDDARVLAGRALSYGDDLLPGARAYGEVPFGGSQPKSDATPWDVSAPVTIPDTGFNIAGYIDRLDIAGDGKRALVRDYKTGRPPRGDIRLNGGRELQRCLYAFAVKALLGDDVAISASLLYPREPVDLQLDDPEAVLAEITGYLRAARRVSPAARPCLARIPAATMTTSPSPCRPTPAPPIANAKCRPPRSGSAKSLRSGRRNDEQRVQVLKDDGARRDAISLHDRSILVEAGAGSGKTAVMAGRIAAMPKALRRAPSPPSPSPNSPRASCSRVREFVADRPA